VATLKVLANSIRVAEGAAASKRHVTQAADKTRWTETGNKPVHFCDTR